MLKRSLNLRGGAAMTMRPYVRSLVIALMSVSLTAQAALAAEPARLPPSDTKSIPVRMIVVANFEPGEDMGDAPGEFQFWAEREKLTEAIPIKGALRPLRRNSAGLYGICWGLTGSLMGGPSEQLMALLLDPRFDFSRTYWLFTGISGVDPEVASVGSAAWARWVISGDALREFDDREVPASWPNGLFAIGAKSHNSLPDNADNFAGLTDSGQLGMALKLNHSLAQWAFEKSKTVKIPDSAELQKHRAAWKGFPNAQRPPFVLMGETLGAWRYWHGPGRTQWARDWVKLWTGEKGRFTMTNMESQSLAGTMLIASKQGLIDLSRVMVLRTASNHSTPPPGVSAIVSVGDEGPGQIAAYEANYRVGLPVVREILGQWEIYENSVPGTAPQ
jgi:purine nucleoside permease